MTETPDESATLRAAIDQLTLNGDQLSGEEKEYAVGRLRALITQAGPDVEGSWRRVVIELFRRRSASEGDEPELTQAEREFYAENLATMTDRDELVFDETALRGELISLSVSAEMMMTGAITTHVAPFASIKDVTQAQADRVNFLAGDILGRVPLGDKVYLFLRVIADRDLGSVAPGLTRKRLDRWVELRNIAAHHTLIMGETLVSKGAVSLMRRDPDAFRSFSRGKAYLNSETSSQAVELFREIREAARLVYIAVLDVETPGWSADGMSIE